MFSLPSLGSVVPPPMRSVEIVYLLDMNGRRCSEVAFRKKSMSEGPKQQITKVTKYDKIRNTIRFYIKRRYDSLAASQKVSELMTYDAAGFLTRPISGLIRHKALLFVTGLNPSAISHYIRDQLWVLMPPWLYWCYLRCLQLRHFHLHSQEDCRIDT